MARRKSPLHDVFELAALMPWWLSLFLAAALWIGLRAFANTEIPIDPTNPVGSAPQAIWRGLAQFGQYVLPIIFLAGMTANLGKRFRARGMLNQISTSVDSDPLEDISWPDFELLVGEIFRRRGYAVVETPKGADGGVDLVVRRNGERMLVQCKHWRSRDVGVAVVRELFGVVTASKASSGAVVTGGRFTAEARTFARQASIELIDGEVLRAEAKAGRAGPAQEPVNSSLPGMPVCPVCQSAMVRRTARRGGNSGRAFWGCSRYPQCRGTRDIA